MERQIKERLIGAALLVIAGVILIPWLLDGKTSVISSEQELVLPGSTRQHLETRTIALDASNPGGGSQPVTSSSSGTGLRNETGLSADKGATIVTKPLPVETKTTPPLVTAREPATPAPVDKQSAPAATGRPAIAESEKPPAVFEDTLVAEKRVASAITVAPSPEPVTGKAWAVQVGSFSLQENAERLSQQLLDKNYKAFVMRNVVDGRVLYRVRIGPVTDRAEADLLEAALKEDRQPAKVLSHP